MGCGGPAAQAQASRSSGLPLLMGLGILTLQRGLTQEAKPAHTTLAYTPLARVGSHGHFTAKQPGKCSLGARKTEGRPGSVSARCISGPLRGSGPEWIRSRTHNCRARSLQFKLRPPREKRFSLAAGQEPQPGAWLSCTLQTPGRRRLSVNPLPEAGSRAGAPAARLA